MPNNGCRIFSTTPRAKAETLKPLACCASVICYKSEPERCDEGTSPYWALKPRKVSSAPRESATLAQCIGKSRVFQHGKLLPKQNIDEKATEHPNLQDQQSHS